MMRLFPGLGRNSNQSTAADQPAEHPPQAVIAVPTAAVFTSPLQQRLMTPDASFKVPNFISRDRSLPNAAVQLRRLRTQEELALALRLESNLQSHAGTDFANRMLHYFSNSSLTTPEIFTKLREEIPLYSGVIAPNNSSTLVFRGLGVPQSMIEQVLMSPRGPESREFAHQLMHGFKNPDGSYRLGTGVTSTTTLESFAEKMIEMRLLSGGRVALMIHVSLLGDQPGNGRRGARGVAFQTNALPNHMNAISEHELVLDLTNRYEITSIEDRDENGLTVFVDAYGKSTPEEKPPVATDNWPQVGNQQGSNEGGRFVDGRGKHWYVKVPRSDAIAQNEYLAARLYQAANVKVPTVALVTRGGKLSVASKIIDDVTSNEVAFRENRVTGVHNGFAVDAWLANWDVVGAGFGNLLVDSRNSAVRIDVGGALLYRARGEPKGDAFTDEVPELLSMLDPKVNAQAAAAFGSLDLNALRVGLKQVGQVSDQLIIKLCKSGPGTAREQAALAQTLIKRRNVLTQEYKNKLPHFHPLKNDDGRVVTIANPTTPSPVSESKKRLATLTFSPQGDLPEKLNDLKFASIARPANLLAWKHVTTASKAIDEPAAPATGKITTGVFIVESDGRVWLAAPTNQFGGHALTFPKGTASNQLTLQQNAVREAYENTGLSVNLKGFIGDFQRNSSTSRFYLAQRLNGTPKDMGWRTQALTLTTLENAQPLLTNEADRDILKRAGHHVHPVADEHGEVVLIAKPARPGRPQALLDANAIMTFVPGRLVTGPLNGVPLQSSAKPGSWKNAAGTKVNFREPPFQDISGKARAVGLLVLEDDGRAWLAEPTNHFGYEHSFAKGRADVRLSLRESAVKQAREKMGLNVELLSHINDFERSTTVTRYYLAKRTGGTPADMSWETQSLKLVPLDQLKPLLASTVDQKILANSALHIHRRKDENGKTLIIRNPTKPSRDSQWATAGAALTFTPHAAPPAHLNGISMAPVKAPAWKNHPYARLADEPAANGIKASGVVIVENDGRVWLVEPTNHFGNCRSTFPKGRSDAQLSLGENALKETHEETGLIVKLDSFIGDYTRSSGKARFYLAKRVGGSPQDMGWESQSVSLMKVADARSRLDRSTDLQLLDDVTRHLHPCATDDGQQLIIQHPSTPSSAQEWRDPAAALTFTPNGKAPQRLNGIALQEWEAPKTLAGWQRLLPGHVGFEEPPFVAAPDKKTSSGAVIIEPDGRLWLVEPSNHFGGYQHTFPKGQVTEGLSLAQNALKEAYEETGLRIELKGVLGDYERRSSKARLYVGVRVGGTPTAMGWESQSVKLLSPDAARQLLNGSQDKTIVDRALAHIHPALDEGGRHPVINAPTQPSNRNLWAQPLADLTFIPGGKVPEALNGIVFQPVALPDTLEGWKRVDGQNPGIVEPAFVPTPNKAASAGALILEADGRVWMTEPTNHFGGYRHSFPKGKLSDGLTLQQTALKEVLEETGLQVKLLAFVGDIERNTSKARFYLAQRTGGSPAAMGWESQSMRLVTREQATRLLNGTIDASLLQQLNAFVHPNKSSTGPVVMIHRPSVPTSADFWTDPTRTVTVTPGGNAPARLNGVALQKVTHAQQAAFWTAAQHPAISEPDYVARPGKQVASGVLIAEPDGRIWVTEPTNHANGYEHTLPKGRKESGLSLTQNARKKAFELTGLNVKIIGFLSDVERSSSYTRFYLAQRIGGTPADMGLKTQALKLAPLEDAHTLFTHRADLSVLTHTLNSLHPRMTEKGEPLFIHSPAVASPQSDWENPAAALTFTPRQRVSGQFNGVSFSRWVAPKTLADWRNYQAGTGTFNEPPFSDLPGKRAGSGAVIVEPDGRIWLTEPTNHFGGYAHTFPKGGLESGLTMRQNAIKEAFEETGLRIELTDFLGDFDRNTSRARYYLAKRVSGTPQDMGWESQSLKVLSPQEAKRLVNRSVDKAIVNEVLAVRQSAAAVQQARIDFDPDLAARIGAQARGALARSKIKVQGNDGVVQVDIRGPKAVFDKVGLSGLHTTFPKVLHYKAVDPGRFEVNVVGSKLYRPDRQTGAQLMTDLFGGTRLETAKRHVVVNGTFYNIHANFGLPPYAPIGATRELKKDMPFVPTYTEYADQYVRIQLGSTHFHSGPLLSQSGEIKFGESMLEQTRFRYGENARSDPGMLYHANHPNPRSALVMPSDIGYNLNHYADSRSRGSRWDAIRLVSVQATTRGVDSDGVTLPELAAITRRLETLNATFSTHQPPRSVNLDGGNSVYNATITADGKDEMPVSSNFQGSANFVVLSEKVVRAPGDFLRPAKRLQRPRGDV